MPGNIESSRNSVDGRSYCRISISPLREEANYAPRFVAPGGGGGGGGEKQSRSHIFAGAVCTLAKIVCISTGERERERERKLARTPIFPDTATIVYEQAKESRGCVPRTNTHVLLQPVYPLSVESART